MPSRMEKYYGNSDNRPSRSARNTDLYKELYETKQYSNVEGIATIEKKNEIDISKIQELLKSHEEMKQDKKPIVKRPVRQIEPEPEETEEKNYDIMDVLNKAKSEYNDDNKSRSLKNTQYNILKNINIKEVPEDDSLKNLINTITSTSVLNKMGDRDLSLNLLEELKSNDNTMVGARGSNEIFKKDINQETDDTEIDKSFYTSSLGFREEDFEQLSDIKSSLKKNNVLITILVFVFLVVVITGILFVLNNVK
ncbi:MAG: hypothetical protein E7173_03640 [Firmicutes bacterium]|nr:hypothetical protein [Bacillota bacterium]